MTDSVIILLLLIGLPKMIRISATSLFVNCQELVTSSLSTTNFFPPLYVFILTFFHPSSVAQIYLLGHKLRRSARRFFAFLERLHLHYVLENCWPRSVTIYEVYVTHFTAPIFSECLGCVHLRLVSKNSLVLLLEK
jgi:hypothetical protein